MKFCGGRHNIYCFGLFHQRQFPLIKITLHVMVILAYIYFSLYFNYHGIMYKAAKYVKNTIVPWGNGICCTLKRAADSFQWLAAELSFLIIIEL